MFYVSLLLNFLISIGLFDQVLENANGSYHINTATSVLVQTVDQSAVAKMVSLDWRHRAAAKCRWKWESWFNRGRGGFKV
ncbi:hypothetical protein MKW98_025198 [Papaver atlanticum]|uniref:Secreted protein n=1 Tax=Papaver atlanticum TaxID=357466 RepID=A0AAD4S245_9MAGN|nr:hypothetical protein MKW98_025198 [Papaver atlanticum]